MLKKAAILFWSLLLAMLLGRDLALAEESGASAYQVKAAFLLSFGKFVEWPSAAFTGHSAPLIIGVFGGDPFHGDLERMVRGKQINGRRLTVFQTASPAELKKCHILFIGASEKEKMKDVLQAVQGGNVLTVSETDHFIAAGGMINFVVEKNKIRFEINDAVASQSDLKISSKLLALAKPLEKARPR